MAWTKLGFGLLLACPSCAGSVFIAVAGAFGVSAIVFQSTILVVLALTVAIFWIGNAYRRRNEACPVPAK